MLEDLTSRSRSSLLLSSSCSQQVTANFFPLCYNLLPGISWQMLQQSRPITASCSVSGPRHAKSLYLACHRTKRVYDESPFPPLALHSGMWLLLQVFVRSCYLCEGHGKIFQKVSIGHDCLTNRWYQQKPEKQGRDTGRQDGRIFLMLAHD